MNSYAYENENSKKKKKGGVVHGGTHCNSSYLRGRRIVV
jgi:hypothetical protein